MTPLSLFNTLVGIGTIAIIVALASLYAMVLLGETDSKPFHFFKRHAGLFAFFLATGGMIGSLIYSDIFHFAPCVFCWWQRIFLYPQSVILGVALWKRTRDPWLPSIILSAIGICFSTYHVLLQSGIIGPSGACATTGVSCTKIDVLIFGWLTIPIMCLIMFAGILTFAFVAHRKSVPSEKHHG